MFDLNREYLRSLAAGLITFSGLLIVAGPDHGVAQTPDSSILTVEVRSEADDTPVTNALIRLLSDRSEEPVAMRWTNQEGRADMPLPAPGTYRIGVQLFGYVDWESEPIQLDARGDTIVRVVVPRTAIELEGVTVTTDAGRCQIPPADGPELLRRYEGMVTALERVTYRQASLDFVMLVTEEHMVPYDYWRRRGGHIDVDTTVVRVASPITALPPELLVAFGFERTAASGRGTVFAPTLEVLASNAFFTAHCFRLEEDQENGWLGVGFRSARRHDHVTVHGTVWLDPDDLDVTRVEFGYDDRGVWRMMLRDVRHLRDELERRPGVPFGTRIRVGVDMYGSHRLGGSIDFMRLPDGGTVVRGWELRAPWLAAYRTMFSSFGIDVEASPHPLRTSFSTAAIYPKDEDQPVFSVSFGTPDFCTN